MCTRDLKEQSGISLLEMMITISLVALLFVVAVPNFTISEQTESSQKLGAIAGDIRAAYDMAVLTHKPYRLAFAFSNGDYWLETCDCESFTMGDDKLDRDLRPDEVREKRALFDEEFDHYQSLAGKEVEDAENERMVKPSSPLIAAKDRLRPPEWKEVEDAEWQRRQMGPLYRLRSMQTEHHKNLQTLEELGDEAFAYLYFFPQGYVERAVLHIMPAELSDKAKLDEQTYTIVTEPYEGTATIISGYKEVDLSRDTLDRP